MSDQPWQEELSRHGAVFDDASAEAGEASHFGDADAEHEAIATGAALVDFSRRTQIALRGDDRQKFLHNLCTNEVRRLTPGSGCETFLLNAQGKILFHVFVFCQADALLLDTVPGMAERLLAHLDRYLIREQVVLEDLTPGRAALLLAGQQCEAVLRSLGSALPAQRLDHHALAIVGCDVQIRRVDMTVAPGVLIDVGRDKLVEVCRALVDAGSRLCGWRAFEAARIEAGFPWFGRDITADHLPQEVARDQQAISFVKGCYIGQETVARIDALGHVNKTLCGLRFAADATGAAGAELKSGDKSVGQITSAAWSPRAAAVVALGYVRRGSNQPGTLLDCDGQQAEVRSLPMA